jgi:hypothetical protein
VEIFKVSTAKASLGILGFYGKGGFWIIPPFSPVESGRNSPVEYGSYSPDMIGGSLNRHPIKIPIPA